MPQALVYSGHAECQGCHQRIGYTASKLCEACEQDWQCQSCGASMVWTASEWCGICIDTKPFRYHLNKKERPCRPKLPPSPV